jgi:hypothetical protein
MPKPTPGGNQFVYPHSNVLFDDDFTDGFCGWEKLHNASSGTFAAAMNTPLSLSPHGTFGTHSLLLQTNGLRQTSYGTQAIAMKRWTMQELPANKDRVVELEVWFGFGSENNDDGYTNSSGGAPRALLFAIDTQEPGTAFTTSATSLGGTNLGKRCYFIAHWRQINEFAGGGPKRTADWYVNTDSPVAYNPALTYSQNVANGYITPDDGNYEPTGYITDFPFNGNKRNVNYVKLTVNISTKQYLRLQANHTNLNLLRLPSQSSGEIAPPISPLDPLYNDVGFNGGLNAVIGVLNRRDTDSTASYMEIHRTRMTYL